MPDALEKYIASWSEVDESARRALLEEAWAEDATYQDPTASVAGREALVQHIGGFHRAMPGAKIEMTSDVSRHNNRIYFAWRLVTVDGVSAIEGVDFGTLDADGRIAEIVGFFGPPGA